jgi:hypothetical protein
MKYRNTAGRLLDLFQRAAKLRDQRSDKALRSLLGLPEVADPGSPSPAVTMELYRSLVPLTDALETLEKEIREFVPEHEVDLYLKYLPNLQQALFPLNLQAGWDASKAHLSEAALHSLEMCAGRLPQEQAITDDELKSIKADLDELFGQIQTCDTLNAKLKKFLLRQVSLMRQAIDQFWINGGRGLESALEQIVGQMYFNRGAAKEIGQKEPGIAKKVVGAFDKCFALATKMNAAWTLLEHAVKLPLLLDAFSGK